ncbi:MAG TPA: nucleoside triphosphate pyrophosphohydrolase [Deltaproteobacteria bacterium]|nr:nucleoside triphosphate pyrophosphohydrolase [Deltaproteobacteria bacterium]
MSRLPAANIYATFRKNSPKKAAIFFLGEVHFIRTRLIKVKKDEKTFQELHQLINLIKTLRGPAGCPWDKRQKPKDIGKYILEEAYEVIDALEGKNHNGVSEELGDLLFQIMFLTAIYEEKGIFSLENILQEIREKMIRRHPHVFGNEKVSSVREVKDNWQKIKEKELGQKNKNGNLFTRVPKTLPALKRAQKITSLAASYGFDWPQTDDVLKKVEEELEELSATLNDKNHGRIEEEMGDVLFTLVNLSRFLKVDAETALTKTTNKFLRRFAHVEKTLRARGKSLREATLSEMDDIWNESKCRGI